MVWQRRVIGNNSLPNAIHALRIALEDDGKNQKIIKTVPKKGYILEKEFCEFYALPDVDDVEVNAFFNRPAPPESQAVAPGDLPAPRPAQPAVSRRFWYWLVPLQACLLLLILTWIAWPWFTDPTGVLKQHDASAYSHIHLQELVTQNEPSAAAELNKQLAPMLFMLNQHVKNQRASMEVLYAFSGTSLNYTLILKNRCGQKQLAMKVMNWRINSSLLSALIYRESERKLNEMANCVD